MAILYKGFGEEYSAQRWAYILGIRASMFHLLVDDYGKTVEEVADFLGIVYRPIQRKPREGANMAETRALVEELLTASGYEVLPGDVTVALAYNTTHNVEYRGRPLGQYNYKTDKLAMSHGEGLRLKNPIVSAPKIHRTPSGWELTPDTRSRIHTKQRAQKSVEINQEEIEQVFARAGEKYKAKQQKKQKKKEKQPS